jgi:putative transcriptional regulator
MSEDAGSGQVARLRGRLLVAHPGLKDPNFDRTVVLILEHGTSGAAGLVLNRPTETPASEIVEPLGPLASPPGMVHIGGPVGHSAAICLGLRVGYAPGKEAAASTAPDTESGLPNPGQAPSLVTPPPVTPPPVTPPPVTALFGPVCAIDLDGDLASLATLVEQVRLFAGHSGWGPGQLEDELEDGGWFVADSLPADVFTTRPDRLWQDVLRRQRPGLAMLAFFPDDPSTN